MAGYNTARSGTNDCLSRLNSGALRCIEILPIVDHLEVVFFQIIQNKFRSAAKTAVDGRIKVFTACGKGYFHVFSPCIVSRYGLSEMTSPFFSWENAGRGEPGSHLPESAGDHFFSVSISFRYFLAVFKASSKALIWFFSSVASSTGDTGGAP
jgi:hypothetical protein